jgi:serine/threonine-protein kinase
MSEHPLLVGPYELVLHLASGGMAEVYVARRQGPHGFNKTVAVKRILPQLVQDEEFVAMFVNEARVAATLTHPNIVQVFDFGEANGELYMAMEYVRGTNVARLTRRAAAQGAVVPLDVCLHIVLSVLRGLEYAHGARDDTGALLRLVHRDVSPGNVLIDESGAVKLTDFGIARAATVERRTVVGHLKGKLGYMSPEQVMGLELDARSDLFTLGIIFAELLTLRPLFHAPSELEILTRIRDADIGALRDARIPPDVLAVLRRALARSPDVRFEGAHEFADALEGLARQRGYSLGAPRLAEWMARLDAPVSHDARDADVHEASTSVASVAAIPTRRSGQEVEDEWADERVTPPLASYRLKRSDGTLIGPLQYHEVAELFATGSAGSCLVSRDGDDFRQPSVFPELMRFVTSSTVGWEGEMAWAARERRVIERRLLPAWLFSLAVGRKTGAILLRHGARWKKVYLVDGTPEFAASTDKRELLGEHLIASGAVQRLEVEMAMSILPRFGGRLGDALVGLGVLRPVELVRAILAQTVDRYLELFRWREGEIAFDGGASSGEETFPLGVAPLDIVARGVRESYSPDEIQLWLEALGDAPLAPVLSPLLRLDALRWTEGEGRVLAALLGPRLLGDFLREESATGDVSAEEVRRAVFLGLSFGVLRCPGFVVKPLAD